MADQIIDRKTVGLMPDVEVARDLTEGYRDTAEQYMAAAQSYMDSAGRIRDGTAAIRDSASGYASSARDSAAEAKKWAHTANLLGVLQARPDEPARDLRLDGMLWLVTDESAKTVTGIRRWDATDAGQGAFPSDALYPSDSTYPCDRGSWTELRLAASALA